MTTKSLQAHQMLRIDSNGKYVQPEILSSVNLPILPPNSTDSHSSPSFHQQYTHHLSSQSVNPCMDVVALVSRDINTTPASSTTNPQNGQNAGLPPPPAGMSAARSAALMRMRMAQRAKALAAAGIKEPVQEAPENTSSVTRCAHLRLSLWRMSSIAGEQGARIWDVNVIVPDRLDQKQHEYEETSIDTISWSPDGLILGLAVSVKRRSTSDMQIKQKYQFLCLYALQDGQQLRTIPFIDTGEIISMEWKELGSKKNTSSSSSLSSVGSVQHMLSSMEPMGEITTSRDDQESKARQRQRLFQAMRDPSKPKIEEDKKLKDIIVSDPHGFGKTIADFPHSMQSHTGLKKDSVLIAESSTSLHVFLEGFIYLGRIATSEGSNMIGSRWSPKDGNIHLVRELDSGRKIQFDRIATQLRQNSKSFERILQLEYLSSFAFDLLTYSYDAIVVMRSAYQTMHADCIQIWNRRARLTAKRYATHLPSELLMLLATGFANDTMMSVLLGNDTLSENNLKKMRNDLLSSLNAIETMASRLASACQRAILVFEEVKGCALWTERYGSLLDSNKTEAICMILDKLRILTQESVRLTRLLGKEHVAWTHFYRFWMYERVRQEALRDSKAVPEAIAGAGVGDSSYNAMLLTEFFGRGFYNTSIEALLDIKMDSKTRGDEVEDDDEEEGEESRSRAALPSKSLPKDSAERFQRTMSEQNDENLSQDLLPWYRDTKLHKKINETILMLKDSPRPDELFYTLGRKTPSSNDFAKLSEMASLHIGPAQGLAEKAKKTSSCLPSLKSVLVECIEMASPLFYEAFAKWASHNSVEEENKSIPVLFLENDSTIADGRNDGLQSSAKPLQGILAPSSLSPLVRQHLSASHSDCRFAFVSESNDGITLLTIAVTPLSSAAQRSESILTSSVSLGDKVKVLDLNFYSVEEIFLLLERENGSDRKETVLVSLFLNDLTFEAPNAKEEKSQFPPIKVHRYIDFSISGGGNAKKLSLNQRKEVCATLDDEGRLTYWDLVQQGGDEQHIEDKDEDM